MSTHNPDISHIHGTSHADAAPGSRKLSRDTVTMVGDLLPLLDFASVMLAAYFAAMIFDFWLPAGAAAPLVNGIGMTALGMAMLAPMILCDRAFIRYASDAQTAAMLRCYLLRFVLFVAVLLAIGTFTRMLVGLPMTLLLVWATAIFVITASTRALMVGALRRLERRGVLTESVAIVGAGPALDGLMAELATLRSGRVELVGIFADATEAGSASGRDGNVAALLELGKHRKLDWIVIALPAHSSEALDPVVQRLKTLPVPIVLWVGDTRSLRQEARPASPALQPIRPRWKERPPWPMLTGGLALLQRWMIALFLLPRQLAASLITWLPTRSRKQSLELSLDDHNLESFLPLLRAFGQRQFGYVVTPNADHLMRLHKDGQFRALYQSASFVLLDSRFVARLVRLSRGMRLRVCPGSDLTEALLTRVVAPSDAIVMIGGSHEQAEQLRKRYGLSQLAHYDPPMGFVNQPKAFEDCLRYIESHSPFRFCLLAVGSPQQEMLASRLRERGVARGMALCIGASINFLTGIETRAPRALQQMGLEWVFRLLQSPRRMAGRYLLRGPRLFTVLSDTDIVVRVATPVTLAPESELTARFHVLRSPQCKERGVDHTPTLNEPMPNRRESVRGRSTRRERRASLQ